MTQDSRAVLHSYEIQLMIQILAAEQQADVEALLAGSGVSTVDLSHPAFRLTTDQEMLLYTRIAKINTDPSLSLRVGCKLGLANYGILGFGMMSAHSLRDAVQLIADFSPLISWASSNRLVRETIKGERYYKLEIDPSAGDSDAVILEMGSTFSSLERVFSDILDVSAHFHEINLKHTYSEQAHRLYSDFFDCPVVFDQPTYAVWFEEGMLNQLLPHAQPRYASLMRDLCREEMGIINEEGLIDQVRRTLGSAQPNELTINWVAGQFSMSERHFRRRLSSQGTSFQRLLDEFRLDKAQQYLTTTSISTESIAQQLGFSDARAFRAAYKRLSGETPSDTRKRSINSGHK